MKEIVIIGAGDFGKEVAWLIEDINKICPTYIILGFLDDDIAKRGKFINGYEVLGPTDNIGVLNRFHHAAATIAMRDSKVRERIVKKMQYFSAWETLIHPSVSISTTSSIGHGSIVCSGANISVNSNVGSHAIINLNAVIENDCSIGDFTSIMPGAVIGSHCTIGDHTLIGTNATIDTGVALGSNVDVGSGSVVVEDVKDGLHVLGVPARKVR